MGGGSRAYAFRGCPARATRRQYGWYRSRYYRAQMARGRTQEAPAYARGQSSRQEHAWCGGRNRPPDRHQKFSSNASPSVSARSQPIRTCSCGSKVSRSGIWSTLSSDPSPSSSFSPRSGRPQVALECSFRAGHRARAARTPRLNAGKYGALSTERGCVDVRWGR
jgi:hypothetical protein